MSKQTSMTTADWLVEATRKSDAEMDTWTPKRRKDWQERLFVRGKLIFKGSPAGCRIAVNAFSTEPYEILTASGAVMLSNR